MTMLIIPYGSYLPIATISRVGCREIVERDGRFGWQRPLRQENYEMLRCGLCSVQLAYTWTGPGI